MASRRLQSVPAQQLLLLLLLMLLGFATAAAAAGDEFNGDDDIFREANKRGGGGDGEIDDDDESSPMPRRSGGGDGGPVGQPGSASAELAGEAALGGLRRRLELDGALDEAVRAGSAAAEQLRRQAAEIAELRAENAELRAAVGTAASAVAAAAAAVDSAASSSEKRAASPAEVVPPAGVDAERDRDLAQLAWLLAHPGQKRPDAGAAAAAGDGEEASGAACFPAGTPLATCAQVRKRFGLALDAEAAALCDSHRLCAACSASYGIPAAACDRAYVAVADRLCLKEADSVGCRRQVNTLLAAMQAAHAPADAVAASIIGCQRPCAARLLSTVRDI